MKFQQSGRVTGTFLCDQPDSLLSTPRSELRVMLEGLPGDKHYGFTMLSNGRTPHYPRRTEIRNSRQVSILSTQELEIVAGRMGIPVIRPEWLGANLVFSGIPGLTQLAPGTRLFFPQDTVLVVEGENDPCSGPAQMIQSHYPDLPGLEKTFVKHALHLRGLVAWVERPGTIYDGDEVRVAAAKYSRAQSG